ncbi:MAG: A/G-specific adenine glycosylase [Verrucomicrobia bacterium]|nr:A/G-specific adenine glycosylase [Verrucomicrobiota bacterium]
MQKLPTQLLIRWFVSSRRDLPWRKDPTPYAVWISEVMLQQTQVAVVISYFERWMQRFPTVKDLALASLEEVIKLWEGLGYYSRARSLHRGAQYLMEHHGGNLPSTPDELEKIAGLGPYTVGAILSFAFRKKAAAVDGNVVRVLSRFAAIEEDVCTSKAKKWIWDYAQSILPDEEPWLVVEGLIELGATVCTRQPKCFACPLSSHCMGLKKGVADLLPIKGKKMAITSLIRQVAVVESEGFYLLSKGKKGSLMADLYEFPYLEGEEPSLLGNLLACQFKLAAKFVAELPSVQHSFTRYRATLYPSAWKVSERVEVAGYEWIRFSDLDQLPFSSGHRKIINSVKERHAHTTY